MLALQAQPLRLPCLGMELCVSVVQRGKQAQGMASTEQILLWVQHNLPVSYQDEKLQL